MPPKDSRRGSYKSLELSKKLHIIEQIEKGVFQVNMGLQYGISKQTVSDIVKTKEKLKTHAMSYCIQSRSTEKGKDSSKARKRMRVG